MHPMWTPNRITLLRVLIAGIAVALYAHAPRVLALEFGGLAIALTLIAVLLDGVDGFVARRFQLATAVGAQIDILGDRVLENLFFTAFAVAGLVSLWVPVTFFVRGAVTDFLRGLAAERGSAKTKDASAFRRNWFVQNEWSRAIVASRVSRAAYGAAKCASFCLLGAEWIVRHAQVARMYGFESALAAASKAAVGVTLAFCILRAVPVVTEGWSHVVRAARPAENGAEADGLGARRPRMMAAQFRRVASSAAARQAL